MLRSFTKEGFHRSFFQLGLIIYAFLLSFPYITTNIALLLLLLNWLLEGNFKKKLNLLFEQKIALWTIAIFLAYLIGIFHSDSIINGIKAVEIKLAILLLTLIISTSQVSLRLLHTILFYFVFGILLQSIITWYLFYDHYLSINDIYLTFSQGHFRDNYTVHAGLHPTYFSLYLLFSVVCLVYLLTRYYHKINKLTCTIAFLVILYFVGLSLLLSARMPLLSFILISFIIPIYFLLKKEQYLLLIICITSLLFIAIAFYQNFWLSQRFREITETAFSPPTGISYNSTNIRVAILVCAFSGLEQNWLTGFGTGNVQQFLNTCYEENGYSSILYENSYGLHNAYLDIWLSVGIGGLIIFLTFYALAAKHAICRRNLLYLSFLVLFSLSCLTESVLNTNKGVTFFAFFNAILVYSSPSPIHFSSRKSNATL